MVEHQVWFKLNEGVTEEEIQAMLAALRALPQKIEGIQHSVCGKDFSGRSHGFQVGLATRFISREALEIYGPHPAHQEFIDGFRHLWAEVRALDFETN